MSRRAIQAFLGLAAVLLGVSVTASRVVASAGGTAGYAPLTPHAASRVLIRVLDTESSLGPMSETPQEVTLADLVRFHGHPCDGLIAAAQGITLGLKTLFPGGIVDRTDVAAATNASPCYSDVAAYLTGARTLYGTLVIDKTLGDEWILVRRSTGKAVAVRLKPGVKPAGLPAMEKTLRAAGCDGPLIARVQGLQLTFIHRLLASPPASLYEVTVLPAFPYPVTGERPDAAKARCGDHGR
ncbi:MAG: formylmethanofuran dehydrogenase subunit E family protein [Acidobacteriota bacterium]